MGFLGRKNRENQMRLLQAEAESAPMASTPTPTTDPSPHQQITANPEAQSHESQPLPESQSSAIERSLSGPAVGEEPPEDAVTGPEDMLEATFIGRTIKIAREDNWDQDIIPTVSQETQILYENQRGYPPLLQC